MTNEEYRRSRGTDKPFSSSEEQAKAIWNKFVRKEKYHRKKPDATPEDTAKK